MTDLVDYSDMKKGKRAIRCYMEQRAAEADIEPPVLDVGGGHKWDYHSAMGTRNKDIVAVNLPRADSIDIVADAESPLPFRDESFSTVLAFNILEHLYDFQHLIQEAERVLVDGGKFLVFVPFLHRVHGDPSDYTRFTDYRLRRDLDSFDSVDIQSLDEGPISAAYHQLSPLLKFGFLRYLCWEVCRRTDSTLMRLSKYENLFADAHPIGYMATATK